MSDDVRSSEYFSDEYSVFRNDRKLHLTGHSTGGGALLAIKGDISVELIDTTHLEDSLPAIDIVGCKCILKGFFCLHIYVIYIPPNFSTADFEIFLDILEQIIDENNNLLILGDFNISYFNNEQIHDTKSQLMHNFISFLDAEQLNDIVNVKMAVY